MRVVYYVFIFLNYVILSALWHVSYRFSGDRQPGLLSMLLSLEISQPGYLIEAFLLIALITADQKGMQFATISPARMFLVLYFEFRHC
jgi:hypothetical protein